MILDLYGQKFGRLTVIDRAENDRYGGTRWKCLCDCGKETTVSGKCLKSGHTKSCGCLNRENTSRRSLKDLTRNRYGMLTVLHRDDSDYVAPNGKKHVRWVCQCDCGNTSIVDACQLVGGKTKSCGCLHKSMIESGMSTKHGHRSDRLYNVYSNMKNRCYNKPSSDYQYYGARGIVVCQEWLDDYMSFRNWAYENGYDENAERGQCTIDRIDVNGNYEPDNCRWVSMSVQSKNRRNVIAKKINDKCTREDNVGAGSKFSGVKSRNRRKTN